MVPFGEEESPRKSKGTTRKHDDGGDGDGYPLAAEDPESLPKMSRNARVKTYDEEVTPSEAQEQPTKKKAKANKPGADSQDTT